MRIKRIIKLSDNHNYHNHATNGWDTGLQVHHNCPYKRAQKILIALHVYELCQLLDDYLPSYEFLIYASLTKRNNYIIVHDPEIPKQKVSYASVDVIHSIDKPVVIHKHPSGLRDFSGIDDNYINANNMLSILYTDGKFVKAVMKQRMPCGEWLYVDADILGLIVTEGSIDKEVAKAKKIFNEQKNRIEREEYKYYQRTKEEYSLFDLRFGYI